MFQTPLVPGGFSPHLVAPPSSTTPTLAPPSPSQSSPGPATPGVKQEAPPAPTGTPTLPVRCNQSPSPNPNQVSWGICYLLLKDWLYSICIPQKKLYVLQR